MVSDVFSIFDFGVGAGMTGFIGWWMLLVVLYSLCFCSDVWIVGTRFRHLIYRRALGFSEVIEKKTIFRVVGVFFLRVFIYITFLGVFCSFPFNFSPLFHFRHNLGLRVVIWLRVLYLEVCVFSNSLTERFSPPGLPWAFSSVIRAIEAFGFLIRAFTLGGRITINFMSGKLILVLGCSVCGPKVCSFFSFFPGLIAIGFLSLFIVWECVRVFVQAAIFCLLSVRYVMEAARGAKS